MNDDRNFGERVSDLVSCLVSSWYFLGLSLLFYSFWILINTLSLFNIIAFDEPPFFLLNLILSFIAVFQVPFIMMSQNRIETKQDQACKEIKDLINEKPVIINVIINLK